MEAFIIRFLICNIFISIIAGALLTAKFLLRKSLTSRMQYNLGFLLLILLTVPFLPAGQLGNLQVFSWFSQTSASPGTASAENTVPIPQTAQTDWMNDFSITVSRNTPSAVGLLLWILWIAGMFAMGLFLLTSALRFRALKKSALPLQNPKLRSLYHCCLEEMNITRKIPIYSTAFLKSPVIAGLFRPRIYLPIFLISGCSRKDLRYMLLHDLSHYRHRDALANLLMNLACVFYWFNPFVRYALKEMKNDGELACDASVLRMLRKEDYADYGMTLINFAEKISCSPFPFVSGMGGSMAQMKKRVLHIATFQKASRRKIFRGFLICGLLTLLCAAFLPLLSLQAGNQSRCLFSEQGKNVTYLDLTASFGEYDGSFVLYDSANDAWQIYNKEQAQTRLTPVSTYKIYSALLGLEAGIISPEHSRIAWDGKPYPFDSWNGDQTLDSAMEHSVTWYFQSIDRQAGKPLIRDFIQKIGYGSQTVTGDISTYWTDSTLSISPIEQVELLQKFQKNQFGFSPENVNAVKESIHLYAADGGDVYGKTGTRGEQGRNTLGWFIGYLEANGNTYFFATNIQHETSAAGSDAAELTFSILSELEIWQ